MDYGKSWENVELPLGLTLAVDMTLYLNKCELVCSITSKVSDARYLLARYKDGKWQLIADTSRSWPLSIFRGAAISDSLILVNANQVSTDSLSVSWDRGETWQHLYYPPTMQSTYGDYLFLPAKGKIALLRKDSSTLEFISATKTIEVAKVPQGSVRYSYFDEQRLISSQKYRSDSSSLAVSSDGGGSWRMLNSIQNMIDGSVVHGNKDSLYAHWIHVREDGSCTIILSSSLVISSTDHGLHWRFNGMFKGMSFGSGLNLVSETPDGIIFCSVGSKLYKLASENDTVTVVTKSAPDFLALSAVDEMNLVGLTQEGCFYSSDGGYNWFTPSFNQYNTSNITIAGIHDAFVERIAIVNGKPFLYCPENDVVLSYDGEKCRFEYSVGLYSRPWIYRCDDDALTVTGSPVSSFDGLSVSGSRYAFLVEYSNAGNTFEPTPNESYDPCLLLTVPSGEQYVFADSLYLRANASAPWTSTIAGLPRVSRVTAASSMIATNSGLLVAGFRGYTYGESDSVVIVPGGIYSSTDLGQNWSKSAINLEYDPYVWQIVESTDALLYASVSRVTRGSEVSSLYSSESAILQSTDQGRSWNRVHAFNDLRRIASASGHRMATDSHGITYALGDGVVVYSSDLGSTWLTLSDEFSALGCLSDVAVDSNGTVWVASNEGVFAFSTPTSVVAGGDRSGRYTSVWTYPTPASSIARIRLNNLDLVTVQQCSLKLYDVYGTERADLTSILHGAGSQLQYEFAYDTSPLPTGVYVIVFQDQSGRIEKYKMLVIK